MWRDRGAAGFEPHWRYCVLSMNMTLYSLLGKTLPDMTEKFLTGIRGGKVQDLSRFQDLSLSIRQYLSV